ncbi:hypothetical protein [Paenibacillus sp. FSL L8-0499]|uniref:hypothetical protein n=1 Tax=Paenibacillus sp. FSL L8-0499 TaxID=2975334 RepID=UPI0030F62C5E
MNDSEKLDQLLKQALASTAEPTEELNERIIQQFKETKPMKPAYKKRVSIGLMVAIFTLVMSLTAYAATQLFSPKQVAEHLGQQLLVKAFESRDAVEINQSVISGDYNVTLNGIVSGEGLSELSKSDQNINPNRSYAVVSIARIDGSPMPATSEPEYGQDPFFVSPLIKGLKPWQVNITTMNGGYSEAVIDGIMYRLIECDGVEMFADRGVYLAVSNGSSFFSKDAFAYNESTGEISANNDYKGTAILFELPLDPTKADPVKAESYLQELLKEPSADSKVDSAVSTDAAASIDDDEKELIKKIEDMKKKISTGTIISESVKEVRVDEQGAFNYEYDNWSVKLFVQNMFEEGQIGYSDSVSFSADDKETRALQFSRDEKGVITGRIIILN